MTLRRSTRALFTTSCVTVLALALAACGDFVVDDEPLGVGGVGVVAVDVAEADDARSDADSGLRLATERGCRSCHSIDGSTGVGPTWQGLAGSTERLVDGSTVVVDRSYLERSIREPQADIVAGFDVVEMPTLDLDAAELDAIVGYIESLR